jgi:hypothetical protein
MNTCGSTDYANMTGWLVNNEQEKVGRKRLRVNFRFCTCVCVKGLRKTTKSLNNDRIYSALLLNTMYIAYETELLATLSWCLFSRTRNFKKVFSFLSNSFLKQRNCFADAIPCPLWTSCSPLPVVAEVWGWDAHEAQFRCPDEVDGDIWIWSTRKGLKSKFY